MQLLIPGTKEGIFFPNAVWLDFAPTSLNTLQSATFAPKAVNTSFCSSACSLGVCKMQLSAFPPVGCVKLSIGTLWVVARPYYVLEKPQHFSTKVRQQAKKDLRGDHRVAAPIIMFRRPAYPVRHKCEKVVSCSKNHQAPAGILLTAAAVWLKGNNNGVKMSLRFTCSLNISSVQQFGAASCARRKRRSERCQRKPLLTSSAYLLLPQARAACGTVAFFEQSVASVQPVQAVSQLHHSYVLYYVLFHGGP